MLCKPTQKHPALSYYIVGAGLGSARVCRPLALAVCPPAYTERPPLPGLQTRKSTPAPLAGLPCRPLQAKGMACVKKISLFQNFIVGVGGPAVQAPTSKRHGLRKKISLFQNFIVGASIARPPKPCAAARPLGWSRAPPLPCPARECVKFLSHFRNSTVGEGPRSARVCRTRKPENPPPHH